MKAWLACGVVVIGVVTGVLAVYGHDRTQTDTGDSIVVLLLSEDMDARTGCLDTVNRDYVNTRKAIERALDEAVANHCHETAYMSPLHCAILAADFWRAYETEGVLLQIVDYKLDRDSLPLGVLAGGDYLYPAAGALVSLRVDASKVVDAMVVHAKHEREIRLLTWVLAERARSIEGAKQILGARGNNPNLKRALGFLEGVENSSDLLPPASM